MKNKIIKKIIFGLVLFPGLLSAQTGPQRVDPSSMRVRAAPAWSRNLRTPVLGQPYLQTESLVVACADGSIRSFYISGTELWNFDPMDEASPFLARSMEGSAYISDSSGIFKAINRVGSELWRINLGSPVSFSPVVGWDGRVFIPVGSQVFCHTAAGHPLWSRDLGSPMILGPMLDSSGSIVTALENRDFVRISQFGAEERVRIDELPALIASIVAGGRESYILFYPAGRAERIIFDERAPRGSRLSRSSFPSLQSAPLAAAGRGDKIAVTLADGRVQLIGEAGQVLWTGDSHEAVTERGSANLSSPNFSSINLDIGRAAMEFDNRGIYILTTRGATGFAEDGRRRFIMRFEETGSIPGFSEEGMLYTSGRDNVLRAYKLDSRPLNVRRSRFYGPMPEGNYGLGNPPPSPWATDIRRWNADHQQSMYDRIEAVIDSGQIGENETAYVGYLHEMIGSFLDQGRVASVRPRVLPMQQIAFIRLLGRVGSRDTVPFLWHIFNRHHEPAVRAACAEAIGTIGVDPDGSSFVSFSFFLSPNNPHRDPQLLLSAAGSIADICRFSGPPLASDGIMLLRHFSTLSWIPPHVRNQIMAMLDDLYREGVDIVIQ